MGGRTVIIRLNSVQLQLQLPAGTELGKSCTNQFYFWSCTYELPDIIDGMSYWILLNNKSRMEESSEESNKEMVSENH